MSEEKKNIDPVFTSSVTDTEVHVFTEQAWQNYKKQEEEKREYIHKKIFKIGSIALFLLVMFIFASIAWFTMSREVGTGGMSEKSQDMPYTIETRGQSGYYKDKWDKLGSDAIEWQVSETNNLDNYLGSEENPENEEDKPGLEPGDSGVLEFRIIPNTSDSITVDCVFDFKAYIEEPVLNEQGNPVVDENDAIVIKMTEIDNPILVDYVKAHIMLFTDYDTDTGKYSGLISTDEELKKVLKDKTYTRNETSYTTIYWKWPLHLDELTSEDESKLIYDSEERANVINYIAINRTGYFKDCNDSVEKVKADLSALANEYDNSIYNHYNLKYDNADLDIGNNISYVMLSMTVEQ